MSLKKEAADYIDQTALSEAINNLSTDEKLSKDTFKKNYDPHTKLEDLAQDIDLLDKHTDLTSLGVGGILLSFVPFFVLLNIFEYTMFDWVPALIWMFLLSISIFVLSVNSFKANRQRKKVTGHRFSFLDKENLKELLNKRSSTLNYSIGGQAIAIFLSIASIIAFSELFILEYIGVALFFFFLSIGTFFTIRNSCRKNNIKKVIDSSIE